MQSTFAFRAAAMLGFLAVALGAFGAHALKARLGSHGTTAIWETAALYHLVHAGVLLAVAAHRPVLIWAPRLFVAGVVIFSGSLYLLAITNVRWLGAVTPVGGLCLLGGWLALALERGNREAR